MPNATVDATAVFNAINGMNTTVQTGFENVHKKIDEKFKVYDSRLVKLETRKAVDEALKERETKTTDFWMWIVRAVALAGIVALCAIAYQTAFPLGPGI